MLFSPIALSIQYSVKSDLATQIGYNDNIFVTTLPHNSISNISIVPSMRLDISDRNWDAYLNGKVRNNNYSDHNLDGNDVFLDISSNYSQERNVYRLSGAYNKDSNLNVLPTDFGITGNRVKRRSVSFSPQYQRLLTERLIFSASFNNFFVDYIDPATTGSVSYRTNTISNSLQYGLTERDKLSFTLQESDYASKDSTFKYRLSVFSLGLEHRFSEVWTMNFSIGASRRKSTSTVNVPFYFFGQPVIYSQVTDYTDKGKVFNASLSKKFQKSLFTTTVSRNDVASSYGGLNEVDTFKFRFDQNITAVWRYNISVQYEKSKSVTSALSATNHKVKYIDQAFSYTIDQYWKVSATFRYLQREFTSAAIDNAMPHSSLLYIRIGYHFPDVSTY